MNNNGINFSLLDFKKIIFSKNAAIILAVVGIVIIFLSDMLFSSDNSNKVDIINETKSDAKFIEDNEKKLKNIIEQIQGVGKCEVMITLEIGGEYIFAVEKKTNQNTVNEKESTTEKKQTIEDTENKIIIINDNNGGEKPIIVKEILPKIKGIAIVCEGGDKLIVKNRIIETIKTLLDVPINSICVLKKHK